MRSVDYLSPLELKPLGSPRFPNHHFSRFPADAHVPPAGRPHPPPSQRYQAVDDEALSQFETLASRNANTIARKAPARSQR